MIKQFYRVGKTGNQQKGEWYGSSASKSLNGLSAIGSGSKTHPCEQGNVV
jgi:hypothetical protein